MAKKSKSISEYIDSDNEALKTPNIVNEDLNLKIDKEEEKKPKAISDDIIEIINEGKTKSGKPKAIIHKGDSVETMARQTAELLGDSARRLIAQTQKDEKEILELLVNKEYKPRNRIKIVSDRTEEIRKTMNLI